MDNQEDNETSSENTTEQNSQEGIATEGSFVQTSEDSKQSESPENDSPSEEVGEQNESSDDDPVKGASGPPPEEVSDESEEEDSQEGSFEEEDSEEDESSMDGFSVDDLDLNSKSIKRKEHVYIAEGDELPSNFGKLQTQASVKSDGEFTIIKISGKTKSRYIAALGYLNDVSSIKSLVPSESIHQAIEKVVNDNNPRVFADKKY